VAAAACPGRRGIGGPRRRAWGVLLYMRSHLPTYPRCTNPCWPHNMGTWLRVRRHDEQVCVARVLHQGAHRCFLRRTHREKVPQQGGSRSLIAPEHVRLEPPVSSPWTSRRRNVGLSKERTRTRWKSRGKREAIVEAWTGTWLFRLTLDACPPRVSHAPFRSSIPSSFSCRLHLE
jgi:hypothetical protein